MPRLAQVISIEGNKLGGAANVMFPLLEEGRERGWTEIVLNPYATNPRGLAEHCEGIPYQTHTPHSLTSFPRARHWLHRRLQDFKPDVIHVHLPRAGVTVASLRRPPSSVTMFTHHHSRQLLWDGKRWAAFIDRVAVRRFDCVVACSESVRRFLLTEYGYPPSKVECIVNGWSGDPIHNGRKPDTPTVICVANFRPKKRHDLLLAAFERVRARIPDARLVLLGDGPLLEQVRERARRLELSESVEFTGSVDIWPRLASSHVYALPSDFEGLPLALLEAMAAGLPVVASEVEGNVDVVKPGVNGYLVPHGDVESLADRLVGLLSDASLRERMSEGARATAEDATMDRCVARYFDLYEELLRRRDATGGEAEG
jgi:glycosyltransferase involved in cell wall biosynthesis